MPDSMTDAELIDLVQQKAPDELTEGEISCLRTRLRESPALQKVLIEHLHMETYLHRALGESRVSVDAIVERAQSLQRSRWAKAWPVWMGLIVLLAGGIIGWTVWDQQHRAGERNVQHLAQDDPADPSRETPGDELKPEDTNPAGPTDKQPGENGDPVVAVTPVPPEVKPADTPAGKNPAEPPSGKPATTPNMKPEDPWFAGLSPDAERKEFLSVAQATPAWTERETFDQKTLKQWFATVPGQRLNTEERKYDNIVCARLNGFARLQSPWFEDAALRLGLFGPDRLRMHFWNGTEGVTLQYVNQTYPPVWSGYITQREGNKPEPEQMILADCDEGRHLRSRLGPLTIRWQDGALLVNRGSQRLLSLPMAQVPEEVFFQGSTWLSEISMTRTTPVPDGMAAVETQNVGEAEPGRWQWKTNYAVDGRDAWRELNQGRELWTEPVGIGATLAGTTDTVKLTADTTERAAGALAELPNAGVCEVVLQLGEISPGTGIQLADNTGKPLVALAFLRDRRSGNFVIKRSSVDGGDFETDVDPVNGWAAFVAPGSWLRMVIGFNDVKVWTGVDGAHWGRAIHGPIRGLKERVAAVGLFAQRSDKSRVCEIRHLQAREFSTLMRFAPAELRAQVPVEQLQTVAHLSDWHGAVLSSCPADCPLDEWRRCCAVVTLTSRNWDSLGPPVLRGLIDETLLLPLPAETRYRFLNEIGLVFDLWESDPARAMARMYERLGDQLVLEGALADAGQLVSRLQSAPFWTSWGNPLYSPEFFERYATAAVSLNNWEAAWNFAQATREWTTSSQPADEGSIGHRENTRLLHWLEATALTARPELADAERMPHRIRNRGSSSHPVVTQWSKEAYNIMTEFDAALRGAAWEDACRIISSAGRAGMQGLLPDSQDEHLLVSLPNAVELAMREHPPLLQTMRNRFGPIGRLRVREAMLQGDVAAVEAVTVRFYGTEAAAEAWRWLGDRALASGRFVEALAAYNAASACVPELNDAETLSRQRLAGALLGEETGDPLTQSVQFGDATLSAAEFEKLAGELRSEHVASRLTRLTGEPDSDSPATARVPLPQRFAVGVKRQLGGDWGNGDGRYEYRLTDAIGRQTTAAVDAEHIYISTRYQVLACNRSDGNVKWRTGLGGEQGNVHDWPFEAMRPVLSGKQLFVRRLTKRGIELACLNAADGKLQWKMQPDGALVSDPVVAADLLLAVLATSSQTGYLNYELVSIRPDSGEIVAQRTLTRMRDEWQGRPPCELVRQGDRLLCSLSGATILCDFSGEPDWLRMHAWFPRTLAGDRVHPQRQPVLIAGTSAVILPPDTHAVTSLELMTGREQWTSAVPHLVRLVGISAKHVIVETHYGLLGLSREDGRIQWAETVSDLQQACLCDGNQLLVTRRLEVSKDEALSLHWFDPATGRERAHCLLDELTGNGRRIGPFIRAGDRLWALVGNGFKEKHRDLVELKPIDGDVAGPLAPAQIEVWLENIMPFSQTHTAGVLPRWALLTPHDFSGANKGTRPIEEFRGKQNVLQSRADADRPARFFRRVEVPAEKPGKLRVVVGHEAGQFWNCEILAGGKTLWQSRVDDKTAPQGWITQEIDLAEFAGKTVLLQAIHVHTPDQKDAGPGYWEQLELLSGQ